MWSSLFGALCVLGLTRAGVVQRQDQNATTATATGATVQNNTSTSITSASVAPSASSSVNATSTSKAVVESTSTSTGTTGAGSASEAASSASSGAGTPAASATPATTYPQTDVGTGTNDLGWIVTVTAPSSLFSTNLDQAYRTATGPVGSHQTSQVVNFGDYGSQALENFWNEWVGDVEQPPFSEVPEPPDPYPSPEAPPALYPDYYTTAPCNILPQYKFPNDFLFGWATAAQQWEGAVKADGKGPTIWDWASRFPGFIADNSTSDVGDLGYYLYKEDIARLAALGGNVYSFSLFWTRIYPWALAGTPLNQAGLDHYRDVIDYCWSKGVEPVVTLFHWDTPLAAQLEYGGFASDRIIDDFVNYAEIVFREYNGSVHRWVTFNEPVVFCSQMAYPVNTTLPENLNSTVYPYTCSYHLVLAHAKTVHRFRELNIQGEIAFKSDNFLGIPWRQNNTDDAYAVERHTEYQIGIFAEPIYNTGDWPDLIKNDLPPEILPRFNDSQKEYIKCTADFFAIDGYRDGYVTIVPEGTEACVANISDPNWPVCNQVNFYGSTPAEWGIGNFADPNVPWLQTTWQYVRTLLRDLNNRYPTAGGIYLSEFGFAEPYENEKSFLYQVTQDSGRTAYYNSYLGEVLKAINEDGTPVKGTFAWSLVDNFEWNSGFSTRFGTQYVDYNSPTLQRTYKRSILEMSQFWNAHRCDSSTDN